MAVATAIAGAGMIMGMVGGAAGAISASNEGKRAREERETLEAALADQRANMQDIRNPFANMSNQFANLGVATKAAKFQAEQTDVALANTLDTLRASGASAGGATALAQAALQSKQGISANLEQQELANEKAKAQGAMDIQKMQATGDQWMWEQQNEREMMDLDRSQSMIDQERLAQAEALRAEQAAIGNMFGSMSSGMGNMASTL